MQMKKCHISQKEFPSENLYSGAEIRKGVFNLIQMAHPDFNENSFISFDELNKFRKIYIKNLVKDEVGELSNLEQQVLSSIEKNELLSQNIEADLLDERTRGQRIADNLADFGGSWVFILTFFSFLSIWIFYNSGVFSSTYDPYPFILLNLILSCLAAIQAPIIMMSQNRKEQKDRKRSENDYKINLKAELEIKLLHEKIDHLLQKHNNRLIEMQELQMEYMEEILQQTRNTKISENSLT
jgi:uncharacterized membrane protein